MRTGTAIRARGLRKCYRVYDSQRARFMHAMSPSWKRGVTEIWALRDVDLEIAQGESVAIIGRNGGGKSTLLQILTGTMVATSGEVAVNGRVSALLELGSGFNPEYTGRDNVMMNGLILGIDRGEIVRRFDEIARFAEIGDAIDRPVKTYSTGMLMRLAFAVQVLTDPEILVIDEALSVGDFFFQQKCLGYIRSLCDRGVTLVFVSHDMGTVRDLCRRAIYLKEGRVEFAGPTQAAIRKYVSDGTAAIAPVGDAARDLHDEAPPVLARMLQDSLWRASASESAPGAARLIGVALYDSQERPTTAFRMGDTISIKVAYRPAAAAPTHVAVNLKNKFDQVITSTGSSRLGLSAPVGEDGAIAIFEMTMRLLVEAGNYSLTVALAHLVGPNRGENLDASPALGPITVQWDYERDTAPFLGMFGLEAEGAFSSVTQR